MQVPSANYSNTTMLKEFVDASLRVLEGIRLKISKHNPTLWAAYLSLSTSPNNFEEMLRAQGERADLSEEMDQSNRRMPRYIEELLLDSNRANIKIAAAYKKYSD
jgi:hypothetical protein